MKYFWLTPPELYNSLNDEFDFDFDPCPYPTPEWDGLNVEWGKSNFVNPPFKTSDGGPIRKWIVKGIEEHNKGKTVVFLLPVYTHYMDLLLSDDDRFRFLGRVKYLEKETKEIGPNPRFNSMLIILRARVSHTHPESDKKSQQAGASHTDDRGDNSGK